MNRWLRDVFRGLATIAVAACMCAPAEPAAPPPQSPGTKLEVIQKAGGAKEISMEIYDGDIDHLLRLLSKAAGVTIVKSEQVSGKVTVIAPEMVPLDVAFQILDSVLQVRGFAMVRAPTGIYKVVPMADAVRASPPVEFGERPEDVATTDTFITQILTLRNLAATEVASEIEGLLSENASVIPTTTNSLIVTDTAANVHRALTLIADTEAQFAGGLRVFPLQYHDAVEMTDLVDEIILSRGVAGGAAARRLPYERRVTARAPARTTAAVRTAAALPARVGPEFCYPDTRTNSLIVLATENHLRQIGELVEQLDRPISLRDTVFVYPVQNLAASDLARLVGDTVAAEVTIHEAEGTSTRTTPRTTTTTGARPTGLRGGVLRPSSARTGRILPPPGGAAGDAGLMSGAPAMEIEPLAGASGGDLASTPVTVAQAPEAPPTPAQVAPRPEVPAPAPGLVVAVEEAPYSPPAAGAAATIIADDNANLLLVSAPSEQLDLIRQLVEKLDVPPAQVHIQAIIAEVSVTRDTSLGFQWSKLPKLGPYGGEGVEGDFTIDFGLGGEGNGGGLGLFGEITAEEFAGVLTALTTDSRVHILSTPSIFTSNNQQAKIDVSTGVPFVRSTYDYTGVGSGVVRSEVEYKSVGITLVVTPRVTQADVVRMDIEVTANELGASITVAGEEYPSISQRIATATLNVKDSHTIVLGGLMRDTIHESAQRVPLLGDIPLVGALFRSTTTKRAKSELLLFLTPRVVRTPAEAARVTESEKGRLSEIPRSLQPPAGGPEPAPEGGT